MAMSEAAAVTHTLRCHSCSMCVGESTRYMRLVGLFRASMIGKIEKAHPNEERLKCQSCKWVNIFHPVAAPSWRDIEVK
jgi:hypothetical protein